MSSTLEEIGAKTGDTITIVFDIKDVYLKESGPDSTKIKFIPNYDMKSDPEWHVLLMMPSENLKRVENFKLYNQFAEIIWESPVNILGVNFDQEVSIKEGIVEVY